MLTTDISALRAAVGFGVAGNFAGHLEQAGEAADFAGVTAASAEAPKGIFPWYVPGHESFLAQFPISSDQLELPVSVEPLNLQIEPEVGVLFAVAYGADGRVVSLTPTAVGAFNDCSIRRPGARKISEKKNWGPASKGLAPRVFAVDDLSADGSLRTLRIASFLRRDGVVHAYGIDSAAADYSYIGERLIGWIIDRLHHQEGAADTPLEAVGAMLTACGSPLRAVVGIGATRYTPVGESTYLVAGDESIVIVYDAALRDAGAIGAAVAAGREHDLPEASVLTQRVVQTD